MKIVTGIASTTHRDKHRDKMTKGALDDMVLQVNAKFIRVLIDHDLDRQIGINLYAEVFKLDDGEFAVGIVQGFFETSEEKAKFKVGEANDVCVIYKKYLDIEALKSLIRENKQHEKYGTPEKHLNVANSLESHLDSTQVLPDGTVYKIKKKIAWVGDLTIEIYPKDHIPKHFHVVSKSRGINARFCLKTLDHWNNKKGKIKRKDIKKIRNFFESYPDKIDELKNEHRRLCGK